MLNYLFEDNAIHIQLIALILFDVFFAVHSVKSLILLLRKDRTNVDEKIATQKVPLGVASDRIAKSPSLEVSPKFAILVLVIVIPIMGYYVYNSNMKSAKVTVEPTLNGQELSAINGVSAKDKEKFQLEAQRAMRTGDSKFDVSVRDDSGAIQKKTVQFSLPQALKMSKPKSESAQ